MKIKSALLTSLFVLLFASVSFVTAFAQSYDTTYPDYVPVSGGAWMEVETAQGTACVVLPADFVEDTFGFSGSGYNVVNLTNSTVTGNIYSKGTFNFYQNPNALQCRFSRFGTLEVYEPYATNYGTNYRWTGFPIRSIKATNIGFSDSSGDRQNDMYLYSLTDKLLILIFVALLIFSLFKFVGGVYRCLKSSIR